MSAWSLIRALSLSEAPVLSGSPLPQGGVPTGYEPLLSIGVLKYKGWVTRYLIKLSLVLQI